MIAALVLGRKGSVGFPDKNLYPVLGRPLSYYPMKAALGANLVDKVFISTDDERLMDLARANDVEVIFRPPELCTKEALGEDAYVHGYHEIRRLTGEEVELAVLLFCNAATITAELIDRGIEALRRDSELDSAVSVSKYNMWSPLRARKEGEDGLLHPFVPFETFGDPATLNCDRDSQGDVWFADMGVSIVRPRCLENIDSGLLPQKWMGQKIYPLKQWGGCDIDYEWQVPGVDFWLRSHDPGQGGVRPRPHLKDIYRVPGEEFDRTTFERFDKNENLVGLPQAVIDKAMAEVTPEFLATYPPTYKLYRRMGEALGLERENLLVTAGTDAAIKMAFEAFVDPGDEVVFPEPTFAMVEVYARLFQARAKPIAYDNDLRLPLDLFEEAISDRTKLVYIANPDSPTGSVLAEADIERIIAGAAAVRAAVLVDEAYYYFYTKTALGLIKKYGNLVVTRSFSKAPGLASVRLGVAAGSPEIIKAMTAWRPMYEVNSFAVLFGLAVLDRPDWIEAAVAETMAGLDVLASAAAELGLKTLPTNANFVHIEVGADHAPALVKAFETAGMLVRSGGGHAALAKCVRISLGPPEKMQRAAGVLRSYFH